MTRSEIVLDELERPMFFPKELQAELRRLAGAPAEGAFAGAYYVQRYLTDYCSVLLPYEDGDT